MKLTSGDKGQETQISLMALLSYFPYYILSRIVSHTISLLDFNIPSIHDFLSQKPTVLLDARGNLAATKSQ